MIDLRECTVLVNNETEYKAIAAVAKRQGFYWADNVSLDHIYCRFPTRLLFNEEYSVYYNATAYQYYPRDYQCKDILGLRGLILKREDVSEM